MRGMRITVVLLMLLLAVLATLAAAKKTKVKSGLPHGVAGARKKLLEARMREERKEVAAMEKQRRAAAKAMSRAHNRAAAALAHRLKLLAKEDERYVLGHDAVMTKGGVHDEKEARKQRKAAAKARAHGRDVDLDPRYSAEWQQGAAAMAAERPIDETIRLLTELRRTADDRATSALDSLGLGDGGDAADANALVGPPPRLQRRYEVGEAPLGALERDRPFGGEHVRAQPRVFDPAAPLRSYFAVNDGGGAGGGAAPLRDDNAAVAGGGGGGGGGGDYDDEWFNDVSWNEPTPPPPTLPPAVAQAMALERAKLRDQRRGEAAVATSAAGARRRPQAAVRPHVGGMRRGVGGTASSSSSSKSSRSRTSGGGASTPLERFHAEDASSRQLAAHAPPPAAPRYSRDPDAVRAAMDLAGSAQRDAARRYARQQAARAAHEARGDVFVRAAAAQQQAAFAERAR